MFAVVPVSAIKPLDDLYVSGYNYETNKIPGMVATSAIIQEIITEELAPKTPESVVKRTHGVFPIILAGGLETRVSPENAMNKMLADDAGLDMQLKLRDGGIRRRSAIFRGIVESILSLKPENIVGFYFSSPSCAVKKKLSVGDLAESFCPKIFTRAQAGGFRIFINNDGFKPSSPLRDIALILATPDGIHISLCDYESINQASGFNLEDVSFDDMARKFYGIIKASSRDTCFKIYVGPTKNEKKMFDDVRRFRNSIPKDGQTMVFDINNRVAEILKTAAKK